MRHFCSLTLFGLAMASTPAFAQDWIEVRELSEPVHSFFDSPVPDFFPSEIEDTFHVAVPAVPLGTEYFDLTLQFPGTYVVVDDDRIIVSISCRWGTSSVTAGSVLLTPTVTSPHPLPTTDDMVVSGAGGDLIQLLSERTQGGVVLESVRVVADLDPTPVAAPAGQCTARVAISSFVTVPDQVLIHEVMGVPDATDGGTDAANDAYTTRFEGSDNPIHEGSSKAALRPSVIEQRNRTLLNSLRDEGCLTHALPGSFVGGVYKNSEAFGGDEDGDIVSGAFSRSATSFRYVDGAGRGVGEGDLFSQFNWRNQLVGARSDGGYVAGHWTRVKGRMGVWTAMTGTCDTAVDPVVALGPWFGLDD